MKINQALCLACIETPLKGSFKRIPASSFKKHQMLLSKQSVESTWSRMLHLRMLQEESLLTSR